VPGGVPPVNGGGVLLPPPQLIPAATNVRNRSPIRPLQRRRRDGTPIRKKPASKAPELAVIQPIPAGRRAFAEVPASACGAIVVTLRVAVALESLVTDTDEGLSVQVMNAVLEQAVVRERFTVPLLKPFIACTVIVEEPDCPGAERLTAVPPTAKSEAPEKVGHFVTKMLATIEPRPAT
jgi:hypothetical protein